MASGTPALPGPESACPQQEEAEPDWKQGLRREFEGWLASLDAMPEPTESPSQDLVPDLYSFYEQLVAANAEARKANRRTAEAITPHTWQTSALSYGRGMGELVCVPIIPRNTPLPASKSEIVCTLWDSQDSSRVEVYQGEAASPDENLLVGEFMVEGLSPVPAGNPILIHFDLDLNGKLPTLCLRFKAVALDCRGSFAAPECRT